MAQRKLFITLFRAELEDAIEGLEQLSVRMEKRLRAGEITNYVFNENEALLKNEISSLKKLLPVMYMFEIEKYPDVDTLAEAVGSMLQRKVEEMGDPQAILEIIRRKQKKVLKYLMEQP